MGQAGQGRERQQGQAARARAALCCCRQGARQREGAAHAEACLPAAGPPLVRPSSSATSSSGCCLNSVYTWGGTKAKGREGRHSWQAGHAWRSSRKPLLSCPWGRPERGCGLRTHLVLQGPMGVQEVLHDCHVKALPRGRGVRVGGVRGGVGARVGSVSGARAG